MKPAPDSTASCVTPTAPSNGFSSRTPCQWTAVGRSIAYAYLPGEHEVGTEVAVEIFGRWVEGEVASEPLFDPAGQRIRA